MPDPAAPTKPDGRAEQARLRWELPDAVLSVAQERRQQAQHGRRETRTVWALHSPALNAFVGSSGEVGKPWPGVVQVCRIQRVVSERQRGTGEWRSRSEVGYAVTGLGPERAPAAAILKRWRIHWQIENHLHWIRDVTFGEDASPICRGQAPEVMAVLRNAALSLLSWLDRPSVAAAQREVGATPAGVLKPFQRLVDALRPKPALASSPTSQLTKQ